MTTGTHQFSEPFFTTREPFDPEDDSDDEGEEDEDELMGLSAAERVKMAQEPTECAPASTLFFCAYTDGVDRYKMVLSAKEHVELAV